MEEVKLFGTWSSPFSRRVEMALKLKGIPYEYVEEDLSNKSPLLLKYNPVHKKVPVLVHNGKPIGESLVILEYIEETWRANPLLPEDPYARAMARFWIKFIDEKCIIALWKACTSRGEEQEKAKGEAPELLKILEDEIKDKKFFGGQTIGLVDIIGSAIAFWTRAIEEEIGTELLTEEKFPRLCAWAEMFINCGTIKECLPPKDQLIDHVRPLLSSSSGPSCSEVQEHHPGPAYPKSASYPKLQISTTMAAVSPMIIQQNS